MNRNWRVDSDHGIFVVKQILDIPLAIARRNLGVIAMLGQAGIPVCTSVPSVGGDLVVEVADRGYCLVPWVAGRHRRGIDLSAVQARLLGGLLGRIHRALNGLPADAGLPRKPAALHALVEAPAGALAEADRFLRHIAGLECPSCFDQEVVELLEQRKVLLEKYAELRPVDEEVRGPFGWTHGDFQHLNVLWHNGEVAAVLDWDRIRVRPFGEEVARSATLLFGRESGELDLGGVSAFVAGYREKSPLGVDDLADAAERLWWKRMCDYWHLVFHYDRSNHTIDHLFFSATAFLHWWTAHREEVQEAFAAC